MGPICGLKRRRKMKKNKIFELTLTSVFAGIILLMSLVPQLGYITIVPGASLTLVHIVVFVGIFILPLKYALLLGLVHGLGSWFAALLYAQNPFDYAFQMPLIPIIPRILTALAAFYIFKSLKKLNSWPTHGKTIIFFIVSVVTMFAFYYGSKAIVTSAVSDVAEQQAVFGIIVPFVLLLGALFLTGYHTFVSRQKEENILIPSAFVLATISHTVLVLLTVVVFAPSLFVGSFSEIVEIIYGIAMLNGFAEALAAVLIGTPIYIALQSVSKERITD